MAKVVKEINGVELTVKIIEQKFNKINIS